MRKYIPILLGILFVCLSAWLQIAPPKIVSHLLERLENIGYDLQLRTRVLTEKATPPATIAIVDIDDKSLKAEGHWPWPRNKLAELVNQLKQQGVAVIAFDMLFSEKEANIVSTLQEKLAQSQVMTPAINQVLAEQSSLFDNDSILAKSFAGADVVLALGFLPRQHRANTLPPPLLSLSAPLSKELNLVKEIGFISNVSDLQKATNYSGFINIFPDTDGIIRRSPLLIEYDSGVYPSLALQATLTFLGEKIELVTPLYGNKRQLEGIKIGTQTITTDRFGQVLIPFVGRSFTFPYFSATDVLNNKIPTDALLGKIVFIGTSATGLSDIKPTSIDNLFPGVEIQATITNGLLQNTFSYKPAWTFAANLTLTILLGLISAFLFPFFGPRLLSLVIILVPPALLFLNNYVWKETGLILSFLMPTLLILLIALLNLIYGYLFETRRREHLKQMFGQYVPESHINEMLTKRSDFALGGENRDMSVLFADIRNFTAISENLSAAELVELLNTFLTPMTEIIFKHHGTIDKYVGDLIMAFWGAPLKDKFHAKNALQAAVDMQTKLRSMQSIFIGRNWPAIKIGIGISSGLMNVGDMGSTYRRNYTVLGDKVNLASRLEGLTKYYGVDIIVSEETQHEQASYLFRKLDVVKVKGKQKGVNIYEVIGEKAKITPDILAELAAYQQALTYYYQREWTKAEESFLLLQKDFPQQKLYSIYLQRIAEYKLVPVPEDWDGTYEHQTK